MCGICGIYDLRSSDHLLPDVHRMSKIAQHRGPDDSGWVGIRENGETVSDRHRALPFTGDGSDDGAFALGLGHRRLSIIDLSPAGHQPMADPTGRYWIVYNGEVYNYIELRDELIARGRRFLSNTDSEVVLHAFMEWGAECLARFNGMWAIAIYDRLAGTLFCARDRFGIKPFYYSLADGRFAFASEAKQLVVLPWVGSKVDRSQIADFFLWGLENHTDDTFFAGVQSLPASHYMLVTRELLEKGRCSPVRYWHAVPAKACREEEAIAAFRNLLFDSVRLRLRSDVPVGVTLSGGIDSSSVVCIAGEHRRNLGDQAALDAFNVEFEGEGFSERRFAEAAAKQAVARFNVLRPHQEDLARDWSRFVFHMEQPFASLSYFSNYQIYSLIRSHGIPVVLSGQGGDELLLGYERYRVYDTLFALKSGNYRSALAEVMWARRHANMSLFMQLRNGLYFSQPRLRAARRRRLVKSILRRDFFHEFKGKTHHLVQSMTYSDRHDLQHGEYFHYQLPHLLHHEDRMSMAHSIETRLPFLDYRLLDLVLGQPSSLLFRDGWSKFILREAMHGVLPDEVRRRTDKMGYDTPAARLIRQNRALFLPLLKRNLDDPILNVPALERQFDSNRLDERLLCGAVSYLSWKETFAVA